MEILTRLCRVGVKMNVTNNIKKILTNTKKFALWCIGLYVIWGNGNFSWAATTQLSDFCTPDMTMCKIGYQEPSQNVYPSSRINSIQNAGKNGCFNPMPTTVSHVTEEVCMRPDSCKKYPKGKKVTSGKHAGKCLRPHKGMDLAATAGAPVTAAADGWIVRTDNCFSGGGNTVIMKHKKADGSFYTTTYMHLLRFEKNSTQYEGTNHPIPKGSVIGYVGGSGCSNGSTVQGAYGNHLHIELREGKTGGGALISPVCDSVQELCEGVEPFTDEPIKGSYTPPKGAASATLTDCGKLYPKENLALFHQVNESNNNPGAFNKCTKSDTGGCTYGISQMACHSDPEQWKSSALYKYLGIIQKSSPKLYKALEVGGSLDNTIVAACTPPASEFSKKWKALAASDPSFGTSQTDYIMKEFLPYGKRVLKNAGMSGLLNRSPEMDMVILSGAVANAKAMKNNFKAVKKAIAPKTFETATDEEIIDAYYNSAPDIMYGKYKKTDLWDGLKQRMAREKKAALESLAIRKEIENGASLEDASQKATGKRACEENEMPNASTSWTGSDYSYSSSSGSSYTSSSILSAYNNDAECNISTYRNSFQSCIFCDLFEVIFNTASSVAKKSYNALSKGVISLVCVGFALWLGLTVMKFISAMEQKNPSILVKTILNKAFVILMVVMILRMDSADFFGLALEPLFNTGFSLAQIVMAGENGETCSGGYNILLPENGGGLPSSMGVSIVCTIETIQDKLLDLMALGSTSFCIAIKKEAYWGIAIFPHLGYFIIGICLWLAALMLMVIYPFLLIDSVLQLCVATALLPAAVGAFAFDATKKYVGKIWNAFLNCMFNFVFLAIIVFILLSGLDSILQSAGITGNSSLLNAGTSTSYETILDQLAWWGINFLKLVFYMVLSWAVLGETSAFAGKFASGISVGKIGADVGGLAASTTTKVGLGLGKMAWNTTTKFGHNVKERGREMFNTNIKVPYQQMVAENRAEKIENSGKATVDANGNKSLQHRTWYGRKVTDTLQVNPDGSKKVVRTKNNLLGGKASSVENDVFIKCNKTYDKQGNVIKEETKMNTAAGKYLLNRDGTRNDVAIHAIKSGSSLSQDDIDKALMQQMMQERMGGVVGANLNTEFKSRSMERTLDDKGREILTIKQVNIDGSSSIFQMTKGDKRDMLSYTHISKNGKAENFASDGIINKRSSFKMDKDGKIDAKSVKNNYAFAKNFNHANTRSMDSNGKFNRDIPVEQIMMSDEDMALFREQIATYGKDAPMSEFGK